MVRVPIKYVSHLFPADVDECAMGIDNCDQNCANTMGSYTCTCNAGYQLNSDGHTCNGWYYIW